MKKVETSINSNRRPIIFALSFLFSFVCISQNQTISDSLKLVLPTVSKNQKLEAIYGILKHEKNRDTLIYYANMYLQIDGGEDLIEKFHGVYNYLASAYYEKGELERSLEYHHLSIKNANDSQQLGVSYSNIGSVYQNNQDYENAFTNYRNAIKIFNELGDSLRLGTTYISIGYAYYLTDKLDSASFFLEGANYIYTNLKIQYSDYYWSYAEGNLALVLAKNGNIDESENRLSNAIDILMKYEDAYAISEYQIELAKIYQAKGEVNRAMQFALSGTLLARENGYKKFIRDGSELLSIFYESRKDFEKAYMYQSEFMAYNDSLVNADLVRKLASQRTQFEVGQKQAEVDLLTAEKRIQRIILFATAVFALVFIVLTSIIYKYYRSKNKVNKILAQQKIELEDLNETKDKFFSIISHDIRGPVASFQGIGHLIKFFVKSKETDQLLEVADHIDQSVDQLSKLLDNLLAWAMQQQGNFPNVPENLDLNEIANDLVKTLGNMAESKKITLTSTISESIHMWADKNSAMTILRNLVNNSLKFTPEGGSVTINAKQIDGMAEISVADTGVGIPKEKLDKLFKLQDKKSTYGTSGEKGLGLGLQLVYEFMEMNKGSIEVESEEGKGTTFIIKLPLFENESISEKA